MNNKEKIYQFVNGKMNKIRKIYWKIFFGKFGKKTYIYGRIIATMPSNVFIGNNSTINEGVLLNSRSKIIIGNNVRISSYSVINTGGLDYGNSEKIKKHFSKSVHIDDGAWIGSNTTINPGITIGKNSIIGAGAVVTSDIPENCVAVGVPAKVVKQLSS